MRLNLNQLGEAILGEEEAARRLDAYLALLARDDVEYISVKVSSVFEPDQPRRLPRRRSSAWRSACARSTARRSRITTAIPTAASRRSSSTSTWRSTATSTSRSTAFREVLDEAEFLPLARRASCCRPICPTRIACSASSPTWALERGARGGAPIKLRIVKGANLAMERIEAERARLAAGAVRDEGRGRRQLQAHARVRLPARPRARRAPRRRQPQPLRRRLRPRAARGRAASSRGSSSRCSRAWPTTRRGRSQARAGGLLLYAPVVRAEDFDERHRLPRAPARREHRAGELPAPRVRPRAGLARLGARARPLPGRRSTCVDACPTRLARTQDRAPRIARPDAGRRRGGAVRQRAGHRLVAAPPIATGSTASSQRWRERRPEPVPLQIGGELRPAAAQARGATARVPRGGLSLRAGRPRRRRAARSTWRGARAAGLGRAAARRARAGFSTARPPCSPGGAGDLIGAMILDGAKTVAEADPEVSEAIDFARYYARALDAGASDLRELPHGAARRRGRGAALELPAVASPRAACSRALAAGNGVILKPAPEAVLVGWHLAQAPLGRRHSQRRAAVPAVPRRRRRPRPHHRPARGRRHPHRLGRDGAPLPRLAARPARSSPRRAARTRSSSRRSRIATRPSAISCARPSATTGRSARRRAWPSARPRCTTTRRSAASCATPPRASPSASAWDLASRIDSADPAAGRGAPPGADDARRGRGVAARAAPARPATRSSGRPGSSSAFAAARSSTARSASARCSALMRAEDLDEAIDLANDTPFGLTSGIQSLDDREVDRWVERIEAGNLYVNRPITGAIVGRQPFGGWKASSVGPGAKAGGPNYVLQLARWRQVTLPARRRRVLAASRGALLDALPGDAARRRRRRRPCSGRARRAMRARGASTSRASTIRARSSASTTCSATGRAAGSSRAATHRRPRRRLALLQAVLAALTADVPLTLSLPAASPGPGSRSTPASTAVIESEAELRWSAWRTERFERLRVLAPVSLDVPRRGPRGGRDRDRRARPGHRPPRAPLVSPRADGLARAPPLRQRDRARRHGIVRRDVALVSTEAQPVRCRGELDRPRPGDRRGADARRLERARQARGRPAGLSLVGRRPRHAPVPARRALRPLGPRIPRGGAALRHRDGAPSRRVLLLARPRVPCGAISPSSTPSRGHGRGARADRGAGPLRRAPVRRRHARNRARDRRDLLAALAAPVVRRRRSSRPAAAGPSRRASPSPAIPWSTRPASRACTRFPISGSWSWAPVSSSCPRCGRGRACSGTSGAPTGGRSRRRR